MFNNPDNLPNKFLIKIRPQIGKFLLVTLLAGLIASNLVWFNSSMHASETSKAQLAEAALQLAEVQAELDALKEQNAWEEEVREIKQAYETELFAAESILAEAKKVMDVSQFESEVFLSSKVSSDDWAVKQELLTSKGEEVLNSMGEVLKAANPNKIMPQIALDTIAGSEHVSIVVVDSPCSVEIADACVSPDNPTVIQVDVDYIDQPFLFWKGIMTHEFAHIIQLDDWEQTSMSPVYMEVFGGDLELFADCMATVKLGSNYTTGYIESVCDSEQLTGAKQTWENFYN